ncbi:hypothetical protein G7Z17_g7840 [Cylindrodendrum hubeiense]|uniref:Uncharacterized protein n=1 Tax=Cylindrodendrum hubeiense TaxID=595255 RepID=A0A9P5L721_9HYPO|nr:hypothetical protein G7Z17_g7840 [Cylindrodendrum hubeiense]
MYILFGTARFLAAALHSTTSDTAYAYGSARRAWESANVQGWKHAPGSRRLVASPRLACWANWYHLEKGEVKEAHRD